MYHLSNYPNYFSDLAARQKALIWDQPLVADLQTQCLEL